MTSMQKPSVDAHRRPATSLDTHTGSSPGAFNEIRQDLIDSTSPGRGNSDWLSFGDAKRIVTIAEDAGPVVENQMREVLAESLRTGKVGDNDLILGGKALKFLSDFTGVDPSLYLAVASDKAKKAQVASMKARGLANQTSSYEIGTAAPAATAKPNAWSGVLSAFGRGLRQLASRATEAPAGAPTLKNVDDANAYAASRLNVFAKDVGAGEGHLENVSVTLSRSMFSADAFENQTQLHQAIDAATAFAARLAKDTGGAAPLSVVLTPRGRLERTAADEADTLFVPVDAKHDELSLRKGFDNGDFIRPDNRFNPFAHIEAGKKRLLWRMVGNPAGELRTKMRRVIGQSAGELGASVGALLNAYQSGHLDDAALKTQAKSIVDRFVSPNASASSGDIGAQEKARTEIEKQSPSGVVRLLSAWADAANDDALQQEVADFAAAKGGARIVDNRRTFGLVNVDTYDAISVAPAGVLDRHGAGAIGEVELNGTRVGLVNVSSTDVVSVVPDLARMLVGGVSLEKAGL